jgi:hypothetical protein
MNEAFRIFLISGRFEKLSNDVRRKCTTCNQIEQTYLNKLFGVRRSMSIKCDPKLNEAPSKMKINPSDKAKAKL